MKGTLTSGVTRLARLVIVISLLATIGCGSQEGVLLTPTEGASGGQEDVLLTPEDVDSEVDGAPTLGLLTGVIIGANCNMSPFSDETTITLMAIPEGGGQPLAQIEIPLPAGTSTAFDCRDGSYAFRQVFNEDYSRMAVTIRNSADQSEHVGYINTATGELVDLETDSTSDFAAASQNHNAVFDPASGDLWFVAGNPSGMNVGTIMSMPADGGDSAETGEAFQYVGQDKFVLAGKSGHIAIPTNSNGLPLPNPPGTVTALYNSIGGAELRAALTLVDPANPEGDHGKEGERVLSVEGQDLPAPGLVPVAWVDDDTLITSVDISTMSNLRASSLQLFDFSPDLQGLQSTYRVIPDSDRTNRSPVVSPEGDTLAFLSYRGETGGLYTVPLSESGPTDPTLLSDTTYPGVLLEWR